MSGDYEENVHVAYKFADKIDKMKEAWDKYKAFLMEKYPAEEGKEWEFTCEHHQRIDKILNEEVE